MSVNIYADDNDVTCEWCGADVSLEEAEAIKPPGGPITMCVHCVPDNPDWDADAVGETVRAD